MRYSELLQKYIGEKGARTFPGYGTGLLFSKHGGSTVIKEIGDDYVMLETVDPRQTKSIEIVPLSSFYLSEYYE